MTRRCNTASPGITVGSIYAIVAIGFNIIYNTTGIINFAQGEFVVIGAMTAISLSARMPLAAAIALAVLITALVGGAGRDRLHPLDQAAHGPAPDRHHHRRSPSSCAEPSCTSGTRRCATLPFFTGTAVSSADDLRRARLAAGALGARDVRGDRRGAEPVLQLHAAGPRHARVRREPHRRAALRRSRRGGWSPAPSCSPRASARWPAA